MVRRVMSAYRREVRGHLDTAFAADHPPRWFAASVATGVFVTTLPTLGTGLIALGWMAYRFTWANPLALFAPVVVVNPLAKSGVYALSFGIGTLILGPSSGITTPELSVMAGRELLVRLILGNVILAAALAAVGYAIAFYGVRRVRR